MHFRDFFLLGLATGARAQNKNPGYLGFNLGSTENNGACRTEKDFNALFQRAQKLKGTEGRFTSVRLYTSIQCQTTDAPIEAYKAAIDTNTKILVGLWLSNDAHFENELKALLSAADSLGAKFVDLVVGISVGSEDMYRDSPKAKAKGEKNTGLPGPTVAAYVLKLKDRLKGTKLEGKPIGHVDTYTTWAGKTTSQKVIDAVDWVGHNAFPYWESDKQGGNKIDNALKVFNDGLEATKNAVGTKPIWITETGWPTFGSTSGQAVASIDNARTYWTSVGCKYFGIYNL